MTLNTSLYDVEKYKFKWLRVFPYYEGT